MAEQKFGMTQRIVVTRDHYLHIAGWAVEILKLTLAATQWG